MSADEFDPAIERLFAAPPAFADSAVFEARVAGRLSKGSRFRAIALSFAGLVGGVIAVREVMSVDVNLFRAPGAVEQSLAMASLDGGTAVQSLLEKTGLAGLDVAAMGGIQGFWVAAGVIVALLAAGAVKLSQQI
ncbi:hypothetical protein [Brevundimonas faecalis]|uniref:Uncharacterized protein n=1 Tax=Brevundimonas faecalis TaxID=947378 RepID=A0ABV2R9Y9_9CAUL